MVRRAETLIEQIEQDALDDSVPLATALRKCIALGGKSDSEKLRDWATRELQGYQGVDQDDLPSFRIVAAPLMMDAVTPRAQVTGQPFSPSTLPEGIREHIKEEVPLRDGVGQIEGMLKQPHIKLSPPGASNIVLLMNHELAGSGQQILSIYWAIAHSALQGVLDQIRTALVQLVAELRANMPAADALPSAAAADEAVNVVVTGKRSRVHVTSAQAQGGSTATASADTQPEEPGFWTGSRRIGAFIVGAVTVAAGIVAILEFAG